MNRRIGVFCRYARKDGELLDQLVTQMRRL